MRANWLGGACLLLAAGCGEAGEEETGGAGAGGAGGAGSGGAGEVGACDASSNRFDVSLTSALGAFSCAKDPRSRVTLEAVLISAERRKASELEDDAVVLELGACEAGSVPCVLSPYGLTVASPGIFSTPPAGARLEVAFVARPYEHEGSEGCKEGLVVRSLPGEGDPGLWLAGNVDLFEGEAPFGASYERLGTCGSSACGASHSLRLDAGGEPLTLAQGEAGTLRPAEGSGIARASGYAARNLASYGEAKREGGCAVVGEFWVQRFPAP